MVQRSPSSLCVSANAVNSCRPFRKRGLANGVSPNVPSKRMKRQIAGFKNRSTTEQNGKKSEDPKSTVFWGVDG